MAVIPGPQIRFSTQYQDEETDLLCYLHRYYNPGTIHIGEKISRPI
jgi:hypothetical protein